jgi:tRNA-(ms[2]io[6]A)-hydroxylase
MGMLPPADVPSLVDRLLVGALIEARSCERFKLLLDALPPATNVELRVFYEELFACEARHYRTYVDLAMQAQTAHWRQQNPRGAAERDVESVVQARLAHLADAEGAIVQGLTQRDSRATVHG